MKCVFAAKRFSAARAVGVLLAALACGAACARTVALWPMERKHNGSFDGRCLIDSTNDLAWAGGAVAVEEQTVGWSLPPNPDAAIHMVETPNRYAVRTSGASMFLHNHAGALARHVARDRSFTVEGWLKFSKFPAADDWFFVVGGYEGNNNHRWMLSFRAPTDATPHYHWHVYGQSKTDNVVLYSYENDEDAQTLTNDWHHVALVHEVTTSARERWTFYLDGEQLGHCHENGAVTSTPPAYARFDLGARGSRPTYGAFDYWRLSDVALPPSEFLCAGEAGTPAPAFETVSYWPLDVAADGGVDGRDAVGDSALSGGFWSANANLVVNEAAPCTDSAFANPPNATVALPNGNAGCVAGTAVHGFLVNDAVGTHLSMTNDFTAEAWIAPRVVGRDPRDAEGNFAMWIFGTRRTYENGWALQLRRFPDGTARFEVYAKDDSGEVQGNCAISGDMGDWYETWRHVALVYDHGGGAGGFGRWELFLDGASAGSLENARAPDVRSVSPYFVLLNRMGDTASMDTGTGVGYGFTGRMDCARVSGAALSPAQFTCAAGGSAATDVLALWPLNVVNGTYFDLNDVVGTYHLMNGGVPSTTAEYCASAVVGDVPSVTNPETSPSFRGDASKLDGSAVFRTMDGNDGRRASLVTGSPSVISTLLGDFTLEFFFKRRASSNRDQEVFFAIASGQMGVYTRFFHDVSHGFRIWENAYGTELADTTFAGTTPDDISTDAWHHLALTHSIETVDGAEKSVWRLFIDGVQKGDAAMTDKTFDPGAGGRVMLLGGRYWHDNNSLRGQMSSVRLTKGVRPPSEFLCAAPAASPAAPTAATLSYWPLDVSAGATNLACLVDAAYGFAPVGAVEADAAVRPVVPRIAELGGGHSRFNAGSAALASGAALVSPSRGLALEPGRTFTVEGWVKWANASDADETVFEAGRPGASAGGVRLFVDKSGATPALRLLARGRWPNTPYADGVLLDDATSLAGVWAHLALVRDRAEWRLYVDGRLAGALADFRAPAATMEFFSVGDLALGSADADGAFTGSFDLWRLSFGVREPGDFLYEPPRGTVFILR